jgi:hypothetical protein
MFPWIICTVSVTVLAAAPGPRITDGEFFGKLNLVGPGLEQVAADKPGTSRHYGDAETSAMLHGTTITANKRVSYQYP